MVTTTGTDTAVIRAETTLAKGVEYNIVALNELASIEPLVLANGTDTPADGFIQLQVVQAAPRVAEVDIYITAI